MRRKHDARQKANGGVLTDEDFKLSLELLRKGLEFAIPAYEACFEVEKP